MRSRNRKKINNYIPIFVVDRFQYTIQLRVTSFPAVVVFASKHSTKLHQTERKIKLFDAFRKGCLWLFFLKIHNPYCFYEIYIPKKCRTDFLGVHLLGPTILFKRYQKTYLGTALSIYFHCLKNIIVKF